MKGKIIDAINHGTIVQVFCSNSDGDEPSVFYIPFDWRMFKHFAESVEARSKDLKGLEIEYDGETAMIED